MGRVDVDAGAYRRLAGHGPQWNESGNFGQRI
jgi:hypothetical protein